MESSVHIQSRKARAGGLIAAIVLALMLPIIAPALAQAAADSPTALNPTFTVGSVVPKIDKTTGTLTQLLKLTIPPGSNGSQHD